MTTTDANATAKRCRCCHQVLPVTAFAESHYLPRGQRYRPDQTRRAVCGPCLRRLRREAKAARRRAMAMARAND